MDQQAESCGKGKCDNPKREGHDVEGEGKFPLSSLSRII